MHNELSFDDLTNDPLIAQLRQADGISTLDFASLLSKASRSYRQSEVARLHAKRADLFYRTIGAGDLEFKAERASEIQKWKMEGPIGRW